MPPPPLPDGPGSATLAEELDALAQRVGRFLSRLKGDVDDVQVWVRRRDVRGYRLVGRDLTRILDPTEDRVALRVVRDGKSVEVTTDRVDEGHWQTLVKKAIPELAPSDEPAPGTPRPRRPGPMTFDPDLADQLAPHRELERVAHAMSDNTWHEAERIPGLAGVSGNLGFELRRYVVGNRGGVVASLHGALGARVELNGVYGDVLHQTHAPESYLPLALLGARTWRTMPHTLVTPADLGAPGQLPVVLHPRLLERLLRSLLGGLFNLDAQDSGRLPFDEGDLVCATAVTLVDDPGLDGLASSRAFDDEGVPTRRTPLIVCGRLTQLLRSRASARAIGTVPSGSAWRRDAPGGRDTVRGLGFGSLLMERGDEGFHEMVASVPRAVLVHEADFDRLDPNTTEFSAVVRWGVTLERDAESRLLAPGAWRVRGRLLSMPGEPQGLLDDVALSRELHDTGSAILPYCMCLLEV